MGAESCRPDDLSAGWTAWILWGAPWILVLAGSVWRDLLLWLWIPGFALAGAGCLYNARRCGRIHCLFSGPLYVLAMVYLLAVPAAGAPFQAGAFLGVVLGLASAAFLAERPLGKYRQARR